MVRRVDPIEDGRRYAQTETATAGPMLRHSVILTWGAFCLVVAVQASLQMLVTFAPNMGLAPECHAAELAGIERVRCFWATGVFVSSGLLAINTALLIALAWRRR